MRRTGFFAARSRWVAILTAVLAVIGLERSVISQGRAPTYRVQPFWPQPFTDQSWVFGSISGVTVDAQNHVWVVHRGNDSLEGNEKGMTATPPTSSVCCQAAPFVLEFDRDGKLLSSWGGPGQGYQWPQSAGNLAVDAKGNVWITAVGTDPAPTAGRGRGAVVGEDDTPAARGAAAGAAAPAAAPRGAPPAAAPQAAAAAAAIAAARGRGRGGAAAPGDAHVLKFSRDGKFLLQIGEPGKMDGPASETTLNRPSAVAYDAAANEVFIADTGNRRIAVFDADSGKYKRHWFAYGEKSAGTAPAAYNPNDPPSRSFRDVTCVEISRDGMVYVCDRSSNRIQVFRKDGTFVREGMVAKNTLGATVPFSGGGLSSAGAVWDLAFSNDTQQRFLFVADGHNKKVRIVQRDTLTEVGNFGSGGRYPGQFLAVDSIATDSQGNLYTGEGHHGKRVQKFEAR